MTIGNTEAEKKLARGKWASSLNALARLPAPTFLYLILVGYAGANLIETSDFFGALGAVDPDLFIGVLWPLLLLGLGLLSLWRSHWLLDLLMFGALYGLQASCPLRLNVSDKLVGLTLIWVLLQRLGKSSEQRWLRLLFAFQLALIYGENALLKTGAEWGFGGMALAVMGNDSSFAWPWAKLWLTRDVSAWLSPLSRWGELLFPLLLLVGRGSWAFGFFLAYHLLSLFSFYLIAAPLVMVAAWWIYLRWPKAEGPQSLGLVSALGLVWVLHVWLQGAGHVSRAHGLAGWRIPGEEFIYLRQKWSMFSPQPLSSYKRLRFTCEAESRSVRCPESILAWSGPAHLGWWELLYSHRPYFSYKLAQSGDLSRLPPQFAEALCRRGPGVDKVIIQLERVRIEPELAREEASAASGPNSRQVLRCR